MNKILLTILKKEIKYVLQKNANSEIFENAKYTKKWHTTFFRKMNQKIRNKKKN